MSLRVFSTNKRKSFRLFSDNKISSDEEFRDYAHNVMKQAHKDNYSEETTNKVVDDLLKNNPDADYGELVGRLTSGFGERNFATKKLNPSEVKLSFEQGPTGYKFIAKYKDPETGEEKKRTLAKSNDSDGVKQASHKARIAYLKMVGLPITDVNYRGVKFANY